MRTWLRAERQRLQLIIVGVAGMAVGEVPLRLESICSVPRQVTPQVWDRQSAGAQER
jgi:hypothetical protein